MSRLDIHLGDEGKFAASLPNPSLLKQLPSHSNPVVEEIFPHPGDREPVQVSSSWIRTGGLFTVTWHYDHLLPDGSVERTSAHAQHHLLSVEQITGELDEAGLQICDTYGDYDQVPYTADAPYLIFLAVRK